MAPVCVPVNDPELEREVRRTMRRLRPTREEQALAYRNALNGLFGERHAHDISYECDGRMPRIDH